MMLCHYLTPETILCPMETPTKQAAITTLVDQLVATGRLADGEKILQAILQRERSGSTFLPIGIALPHARIEGIDDVKMVLGVHPKGLTERQGDDTVRIHLVCLFVSPASDSEFGRHLKLLAWLATVFHDASRVTELAQATDSIQAFRMLQQFERSTDEHHHHIAS